MVTKGIPALNALLAKVTLDYAIFIDKHLQELFPVGCEDHKKFIKDHEIHIRNYPADNTSELWMDNKRVGTFTQRFQDNTFTFKFTKRG